MTSIGTFPNPPDDFAGPQLILWRNIVHSMPSDWFKATDLQLLREMLLALGTSNRLHRLIDSSTDPTELKKLLDLRDREVRRAASLARTLRLPPQSRYDRQVAGTAGRVGGDRPWEPKSGPRPGGAS